MTYPADVMALVAPRAGCPVIWADQSAPRPPKPYMALRLGASVGPENEQYCTPDDQGRQTVVSHRDVTLEVQAFGPGAADLLEALKQRLRWSTTGDAANLLGLAVLGGGPVQNITALLDANAWEPRAMVEVGIRRTQASVDTIGLIEVVNLTDEVGGLHGVVTITSPSHVTVEIDSNG